MDTLTYLPFELLLDIIDKVDPTDLGFISLTSYLLREAVQYTRRKPTISSMSIASSLSKTKFVLENKIYRFHNIIVQDAARIGNLPVVRYLIESGKYHIKMRELTFCTLKNRNNHIAEYLLDKQYTTIDNLFALSKLACNLSFIQFLEKKFPDNIFVYSYRDYTSAFKQGNVEFYQYLKDMNIPLYDEMNWGSYEINLIREAIVEGHLNMIMAAFMDGMSFDSRYLSIAIRYNQKEIYLFLRPFLAVNEYRYTPDMIQDILISCDLDFIKIIVEDLHLTNLGCSYIYQKLAQLNAPLENLQYAHENGSDPDSQCVRDIIDTYNIEHIRYWSDQGYLNLLSGLQKENIIMKLLRNNKKELLALLFKYSSFTIFIKVKGQFRRQPIVRGLIKRDNIDTLDLAVKLGIFNQKYVEEIMTKYLLKT